MICQTVSEALEAATLAKREGLHGLYPSAAIVLAQEVERLKAALQEIAFPRRGRPEEHWDVQTLGEFAATTLRPTAKE